MNRPRQQALSLPVLRIALLVFFCLYHFQVATHAQRFAPALTALESLPVTIPFDASNNLIIIEAMINDRGPYRLVVDTGSSHHVLSREVAEMLGLKLGN